MPKTIIPRKTYDTRVKYLVRMGLLPDFYRKQIHRSLISKWKRESPDKYIGYELNNNMEDLYELMKKVSADEQMVKALKSFYRIIKVLKDTIGTGRDYVGKISEHKYRIVDTIQKCKGSIGVKRAIKLFGISRATYRVWTMETFFKCGHSISKLCSNAYPQQLTIREIHKMHRLLSEEKLLHWPILSVAYYSMKKSLLKAHPNTWYKYARLMKIKRKRHKKFVIRYDEGLRASAPNEKWHADITEVKTADGFIAYIYLVIDNFSRYIISWRVSDKICGKTRIETFAEAMQKAGIKPIRQRKKTTQLIVDGGSENNNKEVVRFIDKYPVEKLIAMKDILKSNAMVEAVNKIIKYDYLYPRHLLNQEQVFAVMKNIVIPDYNTKRPHGSLGGLTPLEAYRKKKVNAKENREKLAEAFKARVEFNQNHICANCMHGCKVGD